MNKKRERQQHEDMLHAVAKYRKAQRLIKALHQDDVRIYIGRDRGKEISTLGNCKEAEEHCKRKLIETLKVELIELRHKIRQALDEDEKEELGIEQIAPVQERGNES